MQQTTHKAFIFADGEQQRWKNHLYPELKQMLPVCGEPVILRTIRQCEARGIQPIVFTSKPRLIRAVSMMVINGAHRWLAEAMTSIRHSWERTWQCFHFHGDVEVEHLYFLLGDVCFSKAIMDALKQDTRPLIVYGKRSELFALKCRRNKFRNLENHLCKVVNFAERKGGEGAGKLFQVYRSLEGFGLRQSKIRFDGGYFHEVHDWTGDFDTPEQYQAFQREIEQRGLVDDLA